MSLERYAPQQPFPDYAFVPGRHPHPVTDPRGHRLKPLDQQQLRVSMEYLYAIDLFNAGYYWEAHEEWEALWVSVGRTGAMADFLKGLIKLAAAGVKAREGQRNGVIRHVRRAAELFRLVANSRRIDIESSVGISLDRLVEIADQLGQDPIVDTTASVEGRPVLGVQLRLNDSLAAG